LLEGEATQNNLRFLWNMPPTLTVTNGKQLQAIENKNLKIPTDTLTIVTTISRGILVHTKAQTRYA
jgi:hypothetical protein